MGKRELVALLNLSPWCLLMVEGLFLEVPWGCLRFVILVFSDHTRYFCWKSHVAAYMLLNLQLIFEEYVREYKCQ